MLSNEERNALIERLRKRGHQIETHPGVTVNMAGDGKLRVPVDGVLRTLDELVELDRQKPQQLDKAPSGYGGA
jgi:hypothetical protein